MKFSILLPTRNRLDLLQYAVASVRQQDDPGWEIIISDNASDQDVAGFVASLADARVRYYRTDRLIPVTENWNAALERSTGDYVIMLGDDDGLMPNCLSTIRRLATEWQDPEVIYTQAMQYAYPGVIPGQDEAFTQVGYNEFFLGRDRPFVLPPETALRMVRSALNFRLSFGFNMQHFIISRGVIDRLAGKGPFFQSPYPDYYAANALLLASRTILANPDPLVMIGISPKSFGFYYFNQREGEGVNFLSNVEASALPKRMLGAMVPGTNMNDSWLLAMDTVVRNFSEIPFLRVNLRRYRLLQFYAIWRSRSWRGIPMMLRHMRLWEMLVYSPVALLYFLTYFTPRKVRHRLQGTLHSTFDASTRFDSRKKMVPYRNLLEAVSQYGR